MFSRKQVMQFRHLDLNDILRNAIKMLERLVGEHVQIDFRPSSQIPAIHADSSMVEQIVMNLAVNARDAMPNGGWVTITTSLETIHRAPIPMDPEQRDGEYVCLTFSDTGIGMDTQILTRIFEPFFTTKPVGKGTGLGLSTVFGIVRQHQGWLEVESKPNKGTTFRVYFPASRQAAEKTEPVVDTALRSGRETVLVAEDEEDLRQMVVHGSQDPGLYGAGGGVRPGCARGVGTSQPSGGPAADGHGDAGRHHGQRTGGTSGEAMSPPQGDLHQRLQPRHGGQGHFALQAAELSAQALLDWQTRTIRAGMSRRPG